MNGGGGAELRTFAERGIWIGWGGWVREAGWRGWAEGFIFAEKNSTTRRVVLRLALL